MQRYGIPHGPIASRVSPALTARPWCQRIDHGTFTVTHRRTGVFVGGATETSPVSFNWDLLLKLLRRTSPTAHAQLYVVIFISELCLRSLFWMVCNFPSE